MKRLLALLLVAAPLFGAWGYYRPITVDYTKVPNTDQTNFAVLVAGTYTDLKTVANGGKVTDANGYDVAFFSDSGLTTQLKHETELWTATTGVVVYWVKIPTVSYTANTVFYMAYGNAAISTDQSDKNNVWYANYKGVYHLPNGTTLTALDSTSNAKDLTLSGGPAPAAMVGKINGGGDFSSTQYASTTGVSALLGVSSARTVTGWLNLPTTTSADSDPVQIFGSDTGAYPGSAVAMVVYNATNAVAAQVDYESGITTTTSSVLTTDTWYHVAAVYSGTAIAFYLNGALVNSANRTATLPDAKMKIQNLYSSLRCAQADLDEVRVSSGTRSADWLATEYNSQSSPSTFYALGDEVAVSGARRRAVVID
jgi:hypothetical protein